MPAPITVTVPARNTGHAANQKALPTAILLQQGHADLGGQTTGDLTHRRKNWKRSVGIANRLVGNADHSGLLQGFGALTSRSQMEVRKEDLALVEPFDLLEIRLLHLDDEIRRGPGLVAGGHTGALFLIDVVRKAAAEARAFFDQYLMSRVDEHAHAVRGHADPKLLILGLARYTYPHRRSLSEPREPDVRPRKGALRAGFAAAFWLTGLLGI